MKERRGYRGRGNKQAEAPARHLAQSLWGRRFRLPSLYLSLLLCGCAEPGTEPSLKAIVGGSVEPSLDAERIPYAVIVIADGKIRAIGPQATTPVPKGAETVAAKGKLLRPMPYDAKLEPGRAADLMMFDAETGAPERIMRDGEWVR
jgi:hypothetical protein